MINRFFNIVSLAKRQITEKQFHNVYMECKTFKTFNVHSRTEIIGLQGKMENERGELINTSRYVYCRYVVKNRE